LELLSALFSAVAELLLAFVLFQAERELVLSLSVSERPVAALVGSLLGVG